MDNGTSPKPRGGSWAFASSICHRVIGNLDGRGHFVMGLDVGAVTIAG